jgi:hypothetical protein
LSVLVDDIVVFPKEIFPEGVEASLSAAGLSIKGAHFGEVVKKGTETKTLTGVALTNREAQTRTVVLRLALAEDAEVTLAEAAQRLEAIVGTLQARDNWFRRDFHIGNEFASLLHHICGEVSLVEFAGWQVGENPDVTLSMVCDYAAYMTEEEASEVFKETEGRELIFELDQVGGSVDGLVRIVVTNKGTEHLRGLILAGECLDHPQDETADTTAAPAYDCVDLTLKGAAAKAEREGFPVVRHAELTAGWLTILNSEIAGVGHMTHKGVRRPEFRVFDPSEEAGDVQFKLRWRALGTLQWEETEVFKSVLVGDWQTVTWSKKLPRLTDPSFGNRRWEWGLQARVASGPGSIDLHRVRIAPTEIYLRCTAPGTTRVAEAVSTKSPGTITNDASVLGPAWANPGNVASSDDSYATISIFEGSEPTQRIKATNFGFGIPEDATITGIVVEVERKADKNKEGNVAGDLDAILIKAGVLQTDETGADDKADLISFWPTTDTIKSYGSSTDLWGNTWTPADINDKGFGFALRAYLQANTSKRTASVDYIGINVYYTEAADENRICFAGRSIEIASDGARRQDLKDDIWGVVVPEGFYPTALPSELDGRKTRYMLVPSQGDFVTLADNGDNPLLAQAFVRPGVLYAKGNG